MKKLFNNSFAMLLCMAMAVTFTACEEPEPEKIDENEKALAFLCDGQTIADGSTYTSLKLDESYAALGMTCFVPGIDLVGDADGKVVVTVESLNQAQINFCISFLCRTTKEDNNYTVSATSDIIANTPLPLEIHYTPDAINDAHRAEALITAYYEGDEANAISFTLVMTNAKVE